MYTVFLDDNLVEIDKFLFNKKIDINNIKKVSNVPEIDEINKQLIDNLNYSVGVYYYIKDSNDFSISYINKTLIKNCFYDLSDIKGAYLSEVFLNNHEGLIKKMQEVYNTGKSQQIFGEYYENDVAYNKFVIKIIKINDLIYVLGKDRKDYSSLSYEQEKLFDNSITGIVIFQNGRFVKCNKKYLELYGHDNYDDIIGKPIGYSGFIDNDTIDSLKEYSEKILNGKLNSYRTFVEVKKDDKLLHYFDIESSYIVYNGEPAVLGIYNDITEQELNKREKDKKVKESIILQKNMDFIQSVSNTGSSYIIDGEYIRSSKLYEILERDPSVEDLNKDILWDIVIDEDKYILEENYEIRSPKHDFVDFIVRIRTGKGNIKYVHCYIKDKYMSNNRKDVVSFYQDVTSEQLYLKYLKTALNKSQNFQDQLKVALYDKDQLLKDKEMLLAEIHHRVKNNLQIVLSLINLNKEYESDPELILTNTENRIYAMALLHEKIYGSETLSDVNIKDYIESLVKSLFEIYSSNIKLDTNMEPYDFKMEEAIPLGLIINELTLNTIKYAFKGCEDGTLYIEFKNEDNHYTLIVKDNGKGLPKHLDLNNLTSLGLTVVQNLTLQLGGTFSILDCEGAGFKIEFDKE